MSWAGAGTGPRRGPGIGNGLLPGCCWGQDPLSRFPLDLDPQRGGPGQGVRRRCPGESLINPGFKRYLRTPTLPAPRVRPQRCLLTPSSLPVRSRPAVLTLTKPEVTAKWLCSESAWGVGATLGAPAAPWPILLPLGTLPHQIKVP